jgi:hypothetical protein
MALVKIGCTLPHGIKLQLAGRPEIVELAGANQFSEMTNRLGTHGTTDIDASFWEAWKVEFAGFAALENGFIFEVKDEKSAKSKVKDLDNTGFEPIDPNSHGVTEDKG